MEMMSLFLSCHWDLRLTFKVGSCSKLVNQTLGIEFLVVGPKT